VTEPTVEPTATPEATPSSGSKAKDTVRNRHALSLAATQRFLPIAEIRGDTVILKNGGLRAVISVEALNFNLKSETEQKGIIAGYQSFVNTLNFPIQIVLRSTKINIDPYLNKLKAIADKQKNLLLKEQTVEYSAFIERIVEAADIMQKRFFVVVPLDDSPERKSAFASFMEWIGLDDSSARALKRHQQFERRTTPLRDRVSLVETGLNNIGLVTRRLNTRDLIELYYQVYNPATSQEQKLSPMGTLNTAPLVL